MGKRGLQKTKKEIIMGMSGPTAMPITQKVHATKSSAKEEICPTCKAPIGKTGSCSSTYLHERNGGK